MNLQEHLDQVRAGNEAHAAALAPIAYAKYIELVTAERPTAQALDRASLEEEWIKAEEKAFRKTHIFAKAYAENGRTLGVPDDWRAHRPRALEEVGGPGWVYESVYDEKGGA
jgi:hypothetical protein